MKKVFVALLLVPFMFACGPKVKRVETANGRPRNDYRLFARRLVC